MSVDVNAVAATVVNQVARRYAGYIDRWDLSQEADIWLWQHESAIRQKLEDEESDGATAGWLRTSLSRHLDGAARGSKAQALGYATDDEYFYGAGMLALILPHVFRGDTEPPVRPTEPLSGAGDPAEGGNWLAMSVDVKRGLDAIAVEDRELLWDRYHEDLTQEAIAEKYGWAGQSTAHYAIARAEGRLVEALGGPRPSVCGNFCQHLEHDERLRRRPSKNEEIW